MKRQRDYCPAGSNPGDAATVAEEASRSPQPQDIMCSRSRRWRRRQSPVISPALLLAVVVLFISPASALRGAIQQQQDSLVTVTDDASGVTTDSGGSGTGATLISYTKCGLDGPGESGSDGLGPSGHNSDWTIVSQDNDGQYRNLPEALEAGHTQIYIKDGTYEISSSVIVGKHNRHLKIRGESRENTILKFTGDYSFLVIFDTEDISISQLTLDAKHANEQSERMWEVIGVVSSSDVSIVDAIVFTSPKMYGIFFAGPSNRYADGQETIDAYNAGDLDRGNMVENTIIYSDYEGDALTFTMQRDGRVNNNKVTKGGISLFMNIDTTCNQNTVLESETYGIFVTVPARNVYIQDNKIIRSRNSGIKLTRQIDHKSEETGEILTPKTYRAGGIKLTGNQIFDTHFLGIEIDQTHQAIVTHNSISRTDYSGIFIQDSDHISIQNNRIEDFGVGDDREELMKWNEDHNAGIYGDANINGANISNNIIIDFLSHGTRYGIKIANPNAFVENVGCVVSQNIISGDYSHEEISTPPTTVQEDNSIIS